MRCVATLLPSHSLAAQGVFFAPVLPNRATRSTTVHIYPPILHPNLAPRPTVHSLLRMQAIEALRQSVKTASDLSVPWDLFHDRLASSSEFMALGAPSKSTTVLKMLATTASKALGASLTAVGMTSLHLKKERLWHGFCTLGGRPTVYFYFDDLEIGLAGVMDSLTGGRVELIRFTCVRLDQPGWRGAGARAKA